MLPRAAAEDLRNYRRVAAGVRVVCSSAPVDRQAREYLEGIAENVSLGGLFIATPDPLPVGNVAMLQFYLDGEDAEPVRAKAIVRWSRRWRRPRGMGLQFVEFEGLGWRRVESWIDVVLARAEPG